MKKAIDLYCNEEFRDFKLSSITQDIIVLAKQKGYFVKIEYGTNDIKSNELYISIAVIDENEQIVSIEDDGHLCNSTKIVSIDSKNRVIFSSWSEKDFIETLIWMRNNLKQM
ncbi:MAG: hypothetical protein ACLFPM_06150 [Candidatus Izemoplasmatales bacterium]